MPQKHQQEWTDFYAHLPFQLPCQAVSDSVDRVQSQAWPDWADPPVTRAYGKDLLQACQETAEAVSWPATDQAPHLQEIQAFDNLVWAFYLRVHSGVTGESEPVRPVPDS